MRLLARLAWIALLLLVLGGGVNLYRSNPDTVHFSFLPWIQQVPVQAAGLCAVFFILGAAVVCAVFAIDHIAKMWTIRKLKKRLAELEPAPQPTMDLSRPVSRQPSLEPMP